MYHEKIPLISCGKEQTSNNNYRPMYRTLDIGITLLSKLKSTGSVVPL